MNLGAIKSRFADSVAAQQCRMNSQDTLRKAVAAGNEQLEKLESEGKPKSVIDERTKSLKAEIHAMEQVLIQLTQTQETAAQRKIADAGSEALNETNGDILVDGSGIFVGGAMVKENGIDLTAKLCLKLGADTGEKPPVNTLKPIGVAMGYFSLSKVKETERFSRIDQYRVECENKLRQKVEDGNVKVRAAVKEGKPKEELDQMIKELQLSVNQAQQDLLADVKKRTEIASAQLTSIAMAVAGAKGLNLIVTNEGVLAGDSMVNANGVDVTAAILEQLK